MSTVNVVGSQAVARAQTVVVVVVIGMLTVFAVATLANIDADLLAFSGYPSFARHRRQRRPDVLRLPRFRRRHLHRQGPRRSGPSAAPGHGPRARVGHRRLRRRRRRRVRHAHRRRGDRLRRHGARRRRRTGARPRRLLDDDRDRAVRHRRGDQRRALPGDRTVRPDGVRSASSPR